MGFIRRFLKRLLWVTAKLPVLLLQTVRLLLSSNSRLLPNQLLLPPNRLPTNRLQLNRNVLAI